MFFSYCECIFLEKKFLTKNTMFVCVEHVEASLISSGLQVSQIRFISIDNLWLANTQQLRDQVAAEMVSKLEFEALQERLQVQVIVLVVLK